VKYQGTYAPQSSEFYELLRSRLSDTPPTDSHLDDVWIILGHTDPRTSNLIIDNAQTFFDTEMIHVTAEVGGNSKSVIRESFLVNRPGEWFYQS
jgi:hypothetical protein